MIVVGTTVAAYKADGTETRWLTHDMDATFFAALEVDARGLEPYARLIARLEEVGGRWWSFAYDDGSQKIGVHTRIVRICAGRNMVTEFALRSGAQWCLFLDSDVEPDPDCLPKLLEVDWPIVGGDVDVYGLYGPVLSHHPTTGEPFGFPVQQHTNTAGFLLVRRDLFRFLRWRYDGEARMTDDPCYGADAEARGWPTLVRKDVFGRHDPVRRFEERPVDLGIRR